jgi:hypothetical protein
VIPNTPWFANVLVHLCVLGCDFVRLHTNTQIYKRKPLGTISIGRCLLYFCCFLGGFVGASTTQMRKYVNAQIAVPA